MLGGNDWFWGRRNLGNESQGLTVIILCAVFNLIIYLIYQMSVFVEENTEIVALK